MVIQSTADTRSKKATETKTNISQYINWTIYLEAQSLDPGRDQ